MPLIIDKFDIKNLNKELIQGENYIFATGRLGREICKTLQNNSISINAYIENNPKVDFIDNIPVITIDKIKNKNANIIISSITYLYDLEKQAKDCGFKNIISFAILTKLYENLQKYNQAFDGLCEDYILNREKYEHLYEILDDKKSKDVLQAVINYRKTLDISVYQSVKSDTLTQYFEPFVPNIKIFVDGGAFDGSNTNDFIKYNSDYQKVYIFEPDDISMKNTKQSLLNYKNIEYFQCGISDKNQVLKFVDCHDSGSFISENGNKELVCKCLDDTIKYDRAYIKLDIEGAELSAIKGAKRLIRNGSPIAISVYHKPEDIWKLPETILAINPNYKLKLRHYTSTIFDTVLYAIPK